MKSILIKMLCTVALAAPGVAVGQVTYPVELRVGVHTDNTKRNTALSDVVTGRGSASIQAFEGMISASNGGAGIGGRIMNGTFDDDFSLKEAFIMVGEQYFHVEGGYGQRSLFGTDTAVNFIRAGAQSLVQIGGSGVALGFSGSKYFSSKFDIGNSKKDTSSVKPDGWEGETDIYYTMPKVPFYLQLGYRTEWFSLGKREENMHAVILGAGLWLGGR